ncbi:MAG: hypothetical protein ACOYIF_00965 [Acetivibrionales bacterium]|jgi:UDP-N-acetylmuramoylalanine--D-glutamate ligase
MDGKTISAAEFHESYDAKSKENAAPEISSDRIGEENNIHLAHELSNVKYYFALKEINSEQTIKVLSTFDHRVILITGGDDRKIPLDALADALVSKVKHLILIGQTSGIIEICLMRKLTGKNRNVDIRITRCGTLKQAVDCAYLSAKPKDSVLLSPIGNFITGSNEKLEEIYRKYVTSL